MGRVRKALCIALAASAIALAGCSRMGLTLDESVRVGIEGQSGYAKLDFPASWRFQATDGDETVDAPVEGATYRSVVVSPDDVDDDSTAQVAASTVDNVLPISPDSSDERIYEYLDQALSQTFPDAEIGSKTINRDGDSATVVYDFTTGYGDDTLTSETKYVLVGDYLYSVNGMTLSTADETDVATVKAVVDDFGYVTNSR